MSSNLDIRNHSALMKRAEQLKRWEESDTNKESPHPKPEKNRKIRFPSGCVFLASCLSGDKDEVVKLLEDGADINTANVDGLTALHQVIIYIPQLPRLNGTRLIRMIERLNEKTDGTENHLFI